jgi:hypothetical protein
LRIFSEIASYIRAVGNSTFKKKLYITKPYHYHIGMCIIETQLASLLCWLWHLYQTKRSPAVDACCYIALYFIYSMWSLCIRRS